MGGKVEAIFSIKRARVDLDLFYICSESTSRILVDFTMDFFKCFLLMLAALPVYTVATVGLEDCESNDFRF